MNDRTTSPPGVAIRAARVDDLWTFATIELAAARAFADVGMELVASADPFPLDELVRYQEAGHAWVAVDARDAPIAYLVVDLIDGNAHVEQVSVHPSFARHGIGRALVGHVEQWARTNGIPAITLTTFRDVAWNGPYYERCGFRTLRADDVTPGLVAIRHHELEQGLDQWPRVCMRREVAP